MLEAEIGAEGARREQERLERAQAAEQARSVAVAARPAGLRLDEVSERVVRIDKELDQLKRRVIGLDA
eukprot:7568798-Lingulodinium_polyedra.AAC.1